MLSKDILIEVKLQRVIFHLLKICFLGGEVREVIKNGVKEIEKDKDKKAPPTITAEGLTMNMKPKRKELLLTAER